MSNIERTLFFVKPDCRNPHIDKATALEIINFLEEKLGNDFKRVLGIRTQPLSKEFYLDFYSHLKEEWSEILKEMTDEFNNKSLAVFVYEGPDIIRRVKQIAGPTKYTDNIGKGTIRKVFGNPNMKYRTIVHASDREGIRKDFQTFKKWGLIPAYL